ncbi:hypothetical protein D9756_006457 [Leucocoprinus leucothites]|uniref:Uncharacterized protein n=1 Tax=Leucocoprinus leucothites TaxID=201217 RepID=A0A8H5LHC0_9AGAR|nr:hypothetical protein D9756_006457 [Leucoagaricus leucothites]
MALNIPGVTSGEATAIINAVVAFLSITTSASIVVLIIFYMPQTHTALTWSSLARTLHASLWPLFLQTDSSATTATSLVMSTLTYLTLATTLLVPITSVIFPLGLHQGPLIKGRPREVPTRYVLDTSPLTLSKTPDRSTFQYGRACGDFGPALPCPGNENPNSTAYAPSVINTFTSTPHGPFTMQFRRFLNSPSYQPNSSFCLWGTAQSIFLREGAFVVDGLIVDTSTEHPGIGFWNQTLPDVIHGGTWSEDVLWLEPMTACVNTNITLDYVLSASASGGPHVSSSFNFTDRGGFYGLIDNDPPLAKGGQDLDLYEHAYRGAVWSNAYAMFALNATRESSFDGKIYTVRKNDTSLPILFSDYKIGKASDIPLVYFNETAQMEAVLRCQTVSSQDIANITNVHIACGAFLGPPLRTDGGDAKVLDEGSRWRQQIHVCASTTRASIQTVTFSSNDTSNLDHLLVTRQPTEQSVLWAVEKTNMTISQVEVLWGRVDNRFEGDPSLSTLRRGSLFLPAAYSLDDTIGGAWYPVGTNPAAAHANAWTGVYTFDPSRDRDLFDYTGTSNSAIQAKLRWFMVDNPDLGSSHIRNAIWTDIMTNNVIGTRTTPTVLVTPNELSVAYKLEYAIPGIILCLIWLTVFLMSLFLLSTRMLRFHYIKSVLNHTSIGRIVVGTSSLRTHDQSYPVNDSETIPLRHTSFKTSEQNPDASIVDLHGDSSYRHQRHERNHGADRTDDTLVTLLLNRRGTNKSAEHLMSNSE